MARRLSSSRKKPVTYWFSAVTWFIILTSFISILAFILIELRPESMDYFALKADNILQGKYLWTLLTHMFVHGSFLHLFLNMFVLFSLGGLCEKIIGRKRFIWFYIIAGVVAGLISVLLSGAFGHSMWGARIFGEPDVYMVGASGAIFAIAGLYVMLLPRLRFMFLLLPFFSLPAYIMVPLTLFAVWIVSIFANWPIGNVAHFGGFLVGIGYGVYLRARYKKKVLLLQRMFR